MKKYNYLLSLFMVPALMLQATNTPPATCSSTPTGPGLNLPDNTQVTGVQAENYLSTTSLYNFTVASSSVGPFVKGSNYAAWCTDPDDTTIPGGITNVNGVSGGASSPSQVTYTTMLSTGIVTSVTPAYGVAGITATLSGTTVVLQTGVSLSVQQEWSAVNWILNHPKGATGNLSPTTTDTQGAIWMLLHPDGGIFGQLFVTYTQATTGDLLTPDSWTLYNDAVNNGTSAVNTANKDFIPVAGQYVAILMVPPNPNPNKDQGFLIPVVVPCTTNLTGSATITKTSNVSSSGANAFQLVTYTYTIRNTGSTTLQNLVIVDDNGTPGYTGDDVTITLPATTTLAAGASTSVTSTVYLPISLFYQSGSQASFDTLIPQVVPVPAGSPAGTLPSLLLTYLIDSDVTDNTYGKNASAGWADNGGHTLAEIEAGYAEFAFYNSKGTVVSDFTVDYLSNVDQGAAPSASLLSITPPATSQYVSVDSTIADDLKNPAYSSNTVTSPVLPAAGWEKVSGYKLTVNNGIFGMYGIGSAAVKKNYLANTNTGFSGKCGAPKAATYTPAICGNVVTSTAYLIANVCGCTTIIHSKCSLGVKCAGSTPTCNSSSSHKCQNPVHCSCSCSQCASGNHGNCTNKGWFGIPAKCTAPACSCTCAQCKVGNHGSCTKVGCTDPTCHANNCGHNTVKCVVASKPTTLCW